MRIRTAIALFCAATALAAVPLARAADDVSFRADVEARKVGVDDTFQLTITVEGRSFELQGEIRVPELKNLRVVGGPSVSTQMSFVNGAMSQARTTTYVLQAQEPGTAEIGPVRAAFADGVRVTEPITLEVVAGSVLERRQRPRDPLAGLFEDPFDSFFDRRRRPQPSDETVRLFVEAEPSRTRLHVGEPLVLTYALFTQNAVSGLDIAQAPTFAGFWSKDLERPDTSEGTIVTRDGQRYHRFPVLKKLLFPTRAGTLTIPASEFKIALRRGFFGDAELTRSTKPIEITAEPVPATAGFSGAVGRFRANATIDRDDLAIGDAATVRFRIEGTGNLEWVDRAPEPSIPGAKVYPPQVKSELKPSPEGVTGSKTWEFVVVPETAGTFRVPPFTMEYFDSATGKMARLETAELPFRVEAGAGPAQATAPATAAPAAQQRGGLRLRAELDRGARGLPSPGGRGIALVLVLVLGAHGALLGLPLLKRAGSPRAPAARGRASARTALADLRRAVRGGMTKEAAAALIEQALTSVFGEVDERATGNGDPLEGEVRDVLRDVRFIRYAPQLGEYSEKIREVAERAAAVIRRRS
ncbi:MAG: protein BatD [Acidobacteria bacterium]|nr:protein BatD [Acidobacteriota bacterium]